MSEYNLGTARGQISVDGSAARAGFGVAEVAAQGFFKAIQDKISGVQQLGKRMAAVGAAGVTGFGVAVKAASSFEAQMSAVAAVSGATEGELDSLRKKALQLGAETQYSASEAGAAMEELVKAGLPIEDILNGAADATVALAAAGAVALPEAATIASNAMNQFGLSAKQSVEVADLLAGAANASSADVSTLGSSLAQVGAVANTAGLSLKDTIVALGQMADRGIAGSDAGTSLKTMLLNLIPTTDAQARKFEEMNLMAYQGEKAMISLRNKGIVPASKGYNDVSKAISDYLVETRGLKEGTKKLADETYKFMIQNGVMSNQFFDQQGNLKSLADIQKVLGNSLKDLSKEQKLATLEQLFGTDAMRGAAIMADQGADGYNEFATAMGKVTAADVAAKRMDNLKGSVEEFKGAVETLLIKIGTPLLGPLKNIVTVAGNVVTAIGNMPDPILNVISVIGALVSVFLLIAGAGLALIPVLAGLVANYLLLKIVRLIVGPMFTFARVLVLQRNAAAAGAAANKAFAASAATVGRMSKVAAVGLKLMGLAMRVLAFAFSGPGIAIIALVAGFILLYKKSETFRNLVNKVGSALAAFGKVAYAALQKLGMELWGKMIQGAKEIWAVIQSQLMPALKELWATIQSLFGGDIGGKFREWGAYALQAGKMIMAALAPVMKFLGGAFIGVLKVVGGLLISTFVTAIKAVIGVLTGFVQIISGVIKVIKGIFTGDWGLIWAGLKQITSGALTAIINLIKLWLTVGILKLFRLGFTLLRAAVTAGWGLLRAGFGLGLQAIIALVRFYLRLPLVILRGLFVAARAVVKVGWALVKAIFLGALKAIVAIVRGQFRVALGIIRGIGSSIRGILGGALGALKGIASAALSRMVGAIKGAAGRAKSAMGSVKNGITGAVSGFGSLLVNAGKELMRGLTNGIKSLADMPKKAFKGAVAGLGKLVPGSPVREGPLMKFNRGGVGKRLMEMLARGIDQNRNLAANAMTKVADAMAVDGLDTALAVTGSYGVSGGSVAPARLASSMPSGLVTTPTASAKQQEGGLRFVDGYMKTDKGFDVYVKGQVAEVNDSNETFETSIDKMNPRRGGEGA